MTLPSGGSIVIDHTEALVSIDINSARATKGGDIEATALNTNLEAAEEIARQLRIRDLGGLIVIDFIDMGPSRHQRDVENRLREAVRKDRARVQIGKISRFGLLEMSRQRLRPSIGESAHMTCPRCSGFGNIRSVESLALAILRIVGEEARKERTAKVIAQLPVEVSTYLLNEKRDWVQNLEDSNDTQIVLVANPLLETPHYEVRRVRDDQTELPENAGVSYELAAATDEPETPQAILERKHIEVPAVGTLKPTKPAPKTQKQKGKGLIATITSLFAGDDQVSKKPTQKRRKKGSQDARRSKKQRTKSAESRRGGDKAARSRKTQQQPQKQSQQQAKKQSQQQAKKSSKKTDSRRKPAQKAAPPKAAKPTQQPTEDMQDESAAEAKRQSRGRRTRGGRRRRRSGDRPEPVADTRTSGNDVSTDVPKEPKAKPDKPSGPPRARTDAERAADTATLKDTASQKSPAVKQETAEPKPAASGNGEDKPAKPKLLPWEPQSLPVAAAAKPESETAARPKSESKPEAKAKAEPEAKAKAEPKSRPKPAPKSESRPKPAPKSKAEPKPEAKPAPKAEPKPEPKPEAKAEPKPEARSKPGAEIASPATAPDAARIDPAQD